MFQGHLAAAAEAAWLRGRQIGRLEVTPRRSDQTGRVRGLIRDAAIRHP